MKQEYKKERVFFASYVHSRERQEFRQVFFFLYLFFIILDINWLHLVISLLQKMLVCS